MTTEVDELKPYSFRNNYWDFGDRSYADTWMVRLCKMEWQKIQIIADRTDGTVCSMNVKLKLQIYLQYYI